MSRCRASITGASSLCSDRGSSVARLSGRRDCIRDAARVILSNKVAVERDHDAEVRLDRGGPRDVVRDGQIDSREERLAGSVGQFGVAEQHMLASLNGQRHAARIEAVQGLTWPLQPVQRQLRDRRAVVARTRRQPLNGAREKSGQRRRIHSRIVFRNHIWGPVLSFPTIL